MTYNELQKKTAELYASGEVYTSPDFQCDQTGGFPISLCVCWEQGKAWLELNESLLMDRDDTELGYYRELCAEYGIRQCCDIEQFNALLQGLGEDAVQSAELDELVEKTFEGSLPAFVAAFARKTDLSQTEIDQLRKLIDSFEEGT